MMIHHVQLAGPRGSAETPRPCLAVSVIVGGTLGRDGANPPVINGGMLGAMVLICRE